MEGEVFDDLRQFIEGAKKITDWKEIKGATWDLEISTLIEATAELIPQPPMLLFDEIKDYPAGFRVLGLPYAAYKRVALAFGLPYEKNKLELVRLASRKVRSAQPIPPKEISNPPVMENTMTGGKVDLLKFPVLRSHASDGDDISVPATCLSIRIRRAAMSTWARTACSSTSEIYWGCG
jgi:UbiD family decarboxylase